MKRNVIHLFSRYRGGFFSLTLVVLLLACNPDDGEFVNKPVEVAFVSIYHAAPNAPAFDISIDGRIINNSPFEYTAYSGYLNFFTGNRDIKFRSLNADNALIDTTFNFEDGKAYSLFAINRLADIEALLVVDSTATPDAGKAMVRFINLAPDAPGFDIAAGNTTIFSEKGFKDATQFTEIDADTYTFEVRNAGDSAVQLSAEDVEILPGRFYTIITRGFVTPPDGNDHILSLEILD